MGFFFRKSINFGPLRFNLSKSGIGLSAGIKGARISTGPRGTELHLGRKGLYYRQKLSGGSSQSSVYQSQAYTQANLHNCIYLRPGSNYTDVVKFIGMPNYQLTVGPPEVETPITILLYMGQGAIFLFYEHDWEIGDFNLARYIGTKAFYPERVLHVIDERLQPILDACRLQDHAGAPAQPSFPATQQPWTLKDLYIPAGILFGGIVLMFFALLADNLDRRAPARTQSVATSAPSPTPAATPSPKTALRTRTRKPVVEPSPLIEATPSPDIPSETLSTNAQRPASRYPEAKIISEASPSSSSSPSSVAPSTRSSSTSGLIRGPRGGCYYYSGSGRKVYVDRSMCN